MGIATALRPETVGPVSVVAHEIADTANLPSMTASDLMPAIRSFTATSYNWPFVVQVPGRLTAPDYVN